MQYPAEADYCLITGIEHKERWLSEKAKVT